MMTMDGEVLYVLDAADNTWVRSPWPSPDSESQSVTALSPDGRDVAHTIWDGERPQMQITELATGAVTDIAPLAVDGVECIAVLADYAPDGESLAVLAVCDAEAGPVAVFDVDPTTGDAVLIARFDGVNLAEGAVLAYSPNGSRLALTFFDVAEPYTPGAAVLDADGTVLQEWDARLSHTPWYGNDALRASGLMSTDLGEWKGYLLVSSGETVGEVRPYDEYPWVYGTPPESALGATHGQFVVEAANYPAEAFLIQDAATGATRAWLRIANLGESYPSALALLHRAR